MLCSFDSSTVLVLCCIDFGGGSSIKEQEIVRKEMGLEWMLRPAERTDKRPVVTVNSQPEEPHDQEVCHFINLACL